MKNHYIYKTLIVLLLAPLLGFGQANGDKKDKIESMRVAFYTQQLDLSSKEAQQFWPVFNEYQDKLDAMRTARRKDNKVIIENVSDKDAEAFIDNEMSFRSREAELQKQYFNRFKQVLPMKKVAKLIRAEDDFKRELIKQIKDKN